MLRSRAFCYFLDGCGGLCDILFPSVSEKDKGNSMQACLIMRPLTEAAPATVGGEPFSNQCHWGFPGRPEKAMTREPGDLPTSRRLTGRGASGNVGMCRVVSFGLCLKVPIPCEPSVFSPPCSGLLTISDYSLCYNITFNRMMSLAHALAGV